MNFDFGYAASSSDAPLRPEAALLPARRGVVAGLPERAARGRARQAARLPNRDELVILHDRNRTVPEAIERVVRYAPAQAQAMIDAGEVFTARAMLGTLAGKAHRQFVVARPWRDGAPGLVRAFVLVAFHVYVWANFWERSGAARTPQDDRDLARIGRTLDLVLLPARAVRRAARLLRRP